MADDETTQPSPDAVQNPMATPGSMDIRQSGSARATREARDNSDSIPPPSVSTLGEAEEENDPLNTWTCYIVLIGFAFTIGLIQGGANYGFLLYVQQKGLSAITYTNIIMAFTVVALYVNIMISKMSDSVDTPFGRRKPFVFLGSLILYVSFLIMSFPTSGVDQAAMSLQLTIGTIGYTLGVSMVYLPMNSWLIESIPSQKNFSKLSAAYQASMTLGVVITIIMGALLQQTVLTAIIVTAFSIVFIPSLIMFVPNPVLKKAPIQPPLIPSFRTCIRTSEFRTILVNTAALSTGLAVAQEFMMIIFYAAFNVTKMAVINGSLVYIAGGVPFLTVISLVTCTYFVARYEKIWLYQVSSIGLLVVAVASVVSMMGGVLAYNGTNVGESTYSAFFTLFIVTQAIIIGLVSVAMYFINSLFLRDLILYDNFVNNVDRENVYQSAMATPVSIIAGVVSGLFKALVYATGFEHSGEKNENDDFVAAQYSWNEGTLIQIMVYILAITGACVGIAMYVLNDYPLTTKITEQMSVVVKDRQRQKAADQAEKEGQTDRASIVARKADEEELKKFTDEVDLWNCLSRLEVNHIVNSPTADGQNLGLQHIYIRNKVGAFFFAPVAMASLLAGMTRQLQAGGAWTTLAITLFNIPAFYLYYEIVRTMELSKLSKLSLEDLKEQAEAAKASNEKYQSNLKSLIDSSGIIIDGTDGTDTSLPRSRAASSLIQPLVNDGTVNGYKRQWAAMTVLAIAGVVFCFLTESGAE